MLSRIIIQNCGKLKLSVHNVKNNQINKLNKINKLNQKRFYSIEIERIYDIGRYTKSFKHIYKNDNIGLNYNSVMHFIFKKVSSGQMSFYLPTIIHDNEIDPHISTYVDYSKSDADKLIQFLHNHCINAEYVIFKNQQCGHYYQTNSCFDVIDRQKIKSNKQKSMIKNCSNCEKIDYYKIKIKITGLSRLWFDICSVPKVR